MPQEASAQSRAELDFEISFANRGGLTGSGFRIDIDDPAATPEELGSFPGRSGAAGGRA